MQDCNQTTLSCENKNTTNAIWSSILLTALPSTVAPKNVENGTRKCPHVIPARSNRGFGTDAQSTMPTNPTRFTIVFMASWARLCHADSSCGCCWSIDPLSAAALAMKYGGSSPIAVPNPYRKCMNILFILVVKREIRFPNKLVKSQI